MFNKNNAPKEDEIIHKTAAASILISPETHKGERVAEISRQGVTYQSFKGKVKVYAKAQQGAAKKLKDEKKARAKGQEEAAKKLKDEKKTCGRGPETQREIKRQLKERPARLRMSSVPGL